MSVMGVKIEQFDVPICNSFKRRVLNNQLCYQVDINRYIRNNQMNNEDVLKSGLLFLMDYNEDRQIRTWVDDGTRVDLHADESLQSKLIHTEDKSHAHIYLNTIGKITSSNLLSYLSLLSSSRSRSIFQCLISKSLLDLGA